MGAIKRLTDLWCEILRRSAECLRGVSKVDVFLAETKVGNFDVAIVVQKKVFELVDGREGHS